MSNLSNYLKHIADLNKMLDLINKLLAIDTVSHAEEIKSLQTQILKERNIYIEMVEKEQ